MALRQTVEPASEPLDLATEVKPFLRVEHDRDDGVINGLIAEARFDCEHQTERQLVTATWKLTLDGFPDGNGGAVLPRPPLLSIVSVVYVATDGTSTTLDSGEYAADTESEPGWLVLAYGSTGWPSVRDQANAVAITYTAGYGAASAVPQALKQLMLAQIALKYDNRAGPWGDALAQIWAGYRRHWHGSQTVTV